MDGVFIYGGTKKNIVLKENNCPCVMKMSRRIRWITKERVEVGIVDIWTLLFNIRSYP